MHIVCHTGHVAALLLAVRAPEDLAYLVKESEIVTGRPGRAFVIAGADRPAYRLQWHPLGFQVERLDSRGRALHIGWRSSGLLAPAHHLACALQEGFPAGRRHTWSASLRSLPRSPPALSAGPPAMAAEPRPQPGAGPAWWVHPSRRSHEPTTSHARFRMP
jgi:hypothetical protein